MSYFGNFDLGPSIMKKFENQANYPQTVQNADENQAHYPQLGHGPVVINRPGVNANPKELVYQDANKMITNDNTFWNRHKKHIYMAGVAVIGGYWLMRRKS